MSSKHSRGDNMNTFTPFAILISNYSFRSKTNLGAITNRSQKQAVDVAIFGYEFFNNNSNLNLCLGEKTGIKVQGWAVRQMKTKWGSCNSENQRILLNLKLAKKSRKSVDYVVPHEIIHIKERLHSDRFMALLEKHMPNWKKRRQELNEVVF
ncbi:MAG: M48 family metallopeptidase [bacterium]